VLQLIFWNCIFITKLQAREPFNIIGDHRKWSKYQLSVISMTPMMYKDEPDLEFVSVLAMGT
jgi:hypothetical protein